MKAVLLLLSIVSASAFADVSIQKTFDGGAARCDGLSSLGQRAYSLSLVSEKINSNNKREVELNVTFLKCAKTKEGFRLVKSSKSETLGSLIYKNSKFQVLNHRLAGIKIDAISEDSDLLSSGEILVDSKDNCRVKFELDSSVKRAVVLTTMVEQFILPEGQIEELDQQYGGFTLNF